MIFESVAKTSLLIGSDLLNFLRLLILNREVIMITITFNEDNLCYFRTLLLPSFLF